MSEIHVHPDGHIYVRTPSGNYADTSSNFATDFERPIPNLLVGANERIYTQNKRHAFMGDGNIIDGGPMPWVEGDEIIADIATALLLQAHRWADTEQALLDEHAAAKITAQTAIES